MDNINTTSVDMLRAALVLKEQAEVAQITYENALMEAVKQNNGKSTFCVDGQWYIVRTRDTKEEPKRKFAYLCLIKDEPKNWLRGRAKKSAVNEVLDSLQSEETTSLE